MRTDDDAGKLLVRLTVGLLILFHGVGKLLHGVDPVMQLLAAAGLPAFIAYGAYLGEVVGPLLVVAGWHARIGAALIAVNMVMALALAHRGQLFQLGPQGGYALELQAFYLLIAVAVIVLGPGRYSVNGR